MSELEPPFSAQLLERLESAVDSISVSQWKDPSIVARWLLFISQSAQVSVPLLECAAEQARRQPRSPFTDLLGEYYMLHALEQRQEQWVPEDLGLRGDSDFVELPSRDLAAMAGSQYYLIRHHHPALLLGYLAFRESHTPTPEKLRGLEAATPPEIWRTYVLRGHPHHLGDLCGVIDEVPIRLRHAVLVNTLRCVAAYATALDSLISP